MYRSRVESDSAILSNFLERSKEVRGWGNRIKGYGLSGSDFNDFENCSRRIFNHRKDEFLASKIITSLKTRRKKTKHYSITPLGVALLFHDSDMDFHQFKKTLDFLFPYAEESWLPWDEVSAQTWAEFDLNLINNILKTIDKKLLIKTMESVLKDIKLVKDGNDYHVYLTHSLPKGTNCVIWKFTVKNNIVFLNSDPKNEFRKPKQVMDEEFFSALSEHILSAYHFRLNQNLIKNKIQRNFIELEEIAGGHSYVIMDSVASSLEAAGIEL